MRQTFSLLMLLFACGDGGGDDNGVAQTCAEPDDANARLVASLDFGRTTITGVLYDSAIPREEIEQDRVGDCALFARQLSCAELCAGGPCINKECWLRPRPQTGGVVSVFFASTRLRMRQSSRGFYETLPLDEPLLPGAPVRVSGDEVDAMAAFDVTAPMVGAVTGDFLGLVATAGDDLTVAWNRASSDNPDDEVIVRLVGDSEERRASIECVLTPPATSVTIDKRLISGLFDLSDGGTDGFIPFAEIERRNVQLLGTRTECVSFATSSRVPITVGSAN